MTGILVLGTGGHARSCLDVALAAGIDVRGCVGPEPTGRLQVPHLGNDDSLAGLRDSGASEAFVAVGDNRLRQRLSEQVRHLGFRLRAVVSPHAVIAPNASIGDGAVVMHQASIGPYSTLGTGAILNTSASIDHDCVLGDFAHAAPGTHLAGDVVVGEGAFLGVGCSVIPGVVIGEWVTAGAGATVVANVRAGTTVVGTPARQRGMTA